MKPHQIVIDTNVLIAGLRSKQGASYQLLTLLNDQRWQINVSTALILEYEAVLKQQQAQIGLSPEDIDILLDGICAIANKHALFYLWRPIARDPGDDFLIELAVAAQADFLITYNQRDLQPADRFGIQVVSPKQFLQQVGEFS